MVFTLGLENSTMLFDFGVFQDSALDVLLFITYMDIQQIQSRGFKYHL